MLECFLRERIWHACKIRGHTRRDFSLTLMWWEQIFPALNSWKVWWNFGEDISNTTYSLSKKKQEVHHLNSCFYWFFWRFNYSPTSWFGFVGEGYKIHHSNRITVPFTSVTCLANNIHHCVYPSMVTLINASPLCFLIASLIASLVSLGSLIGIIPSR